MLIHIEIIFLLVIDDIFVLDLSGVDVGVWLGVLLALVGF